MKRTCLTILSLAFLFTACNEKTADRMKGTDEGPKDSATKSDITYPYKAVISSDMSIGKPEHAKLVLDMFKAWEEGQMDGMRAMLADTVEVTFSDGMVFRGTADSLLAFGKQMRTNYSDINTTIYAWESVHLNNINEDYVLVWANDYVTDKAGKIDSTANHSYWQIVNNKIKAWGEFQRKLLPATPTPPAKKP